MSRSGSTRNESSRRLPSLDGLRAVSIALVLINHLSYAEKVPLLFLNYGDLGVRCFFVISGFLITYLLVKEESATGNISVGRFYSRRLLRIAPVYFVFIAFVAVLSFIARFRLPACNYVTALTYTKDFGCGQWIDGHLWSLSVEEQFYLFWPLVLLAFDPKGRMIFACALILVCPIIRVIYYVSHRDGYYSLFTNVDSLMYGCAAAMLLDRHRAVLLRALKLYPTAGRFLAVLMIVVPDYLSDHLKLGILTVPFSWSAEALGMAYLVTSYATVPSGMLYWLLNTTPVRFVGIISYSLYIWQQPFFMRPENYHLAALPIFWFPMNVICLSAVASCSYYCLERPLGGLRNRLHAELKWTRIWGLADKSEGPSVG